MLADLFKLIFTARRYVPRYVPTSLNGRPALAGYEDEEDGRAAADNREGRQVSQCHAGSDAEVGGDSGEPKHGPVQIQVLPCLPTGILFLLSHDKSHDEPERS